MSADQSRKELADLLGSLVATEATCPPDALGQLRSAITLLRCAERDGRSLDTQIGANAPSYREVAAAALRRVKWCGGQVVTPIPSPPGMGASPERHSSEPRSADPRGAGQPAAAGPTAAQVEAFELDDQEQLIKVKVYLAGTFVVLEVDDDSAVGFDADKSLRLGLLLLDAGARIKAEHASGWATVRQQIAAITGATS